MLDKYLQFQNDSLFEMAVLGREESGLPVDLYLDDSGAYKNGGHSPRIKFMPCKNEKTNSRRMVSMTISENPIIPESHRYRIKLSNKEISDIRKFVVANCIILRKLCDEEQYRICQFHRDMVLNGEERSSISQESENCFPKITPVGKDLVLIVSVNASETIVYDLNPVVRDNSFFSSLKDERVFNEVRLENGILHWDDCSIPLKRILQDKANQYSMKEYKQILAEGLRFIPKLA